MKRSACIVTFLLVLGGIGSAQEIKVTTPWSGQSWNIGDAQDIKWTSTGVTQPNVKIMLWKGETNVLDIVDNTPNNGRYRWLIPGSIAPGTVQDPCEDDRRDDRRHQCRVRDHRREDHRDPAEYQRDLEARRDPPHPMDPYEPDGPIAYASSSSRIMKGFLS